MKRRDLARSLCLGAVAGGPALLLGAQAGLFGRPSTTVTLVGDSTVASRPGVSCFMMGWGRKLAELAHPGFKVINRARSGSSSSGFLANDWPAVRAGLAPGGILLMQFGHVDASRGLSPQASYRPSLQRLLQDAQDAGVRPWLVTPVASWNFVGSAWVYEFAPFAAQMQSLAAEMRLPFVDLGTRMGAELDRLGPLRSRALFMLVHDGQDRLHLTAAGAELAASLVLRELQAVQP